MKSILTTTLCFLAASALHATTPGAVTSFTQQPEARSYSAKTANGIDFKIVFYRDDVFRILAAPEGKFVDPKNDPKKAQILVVNDPAKVQVNVKDTDTSV
ncbi:MAG: hypothetical protein ACPGUY_01480, partial [Akkermansiaceae bacterium]